MTPPDARSRGPHVDVDRATIKRKILRCDRVLVRHAGRNHLIALAGDAFDHICRLIGDNEPAGRYIAWDDVAGGIQIFFARRDENPTAANGALPDPVLFAGRDREGDVMGLTPEQIEIVEFGLYDNGSVESLISKEIAALSAPPPLGYQASP